MHCLEAGDSAIWICVLHSTEQGSDKMLYSWPLGKNSGGVSSPIDPGNNLPFPLGFEACLHFVRGFKEKAQDIRIDAAAVPDIQALFAVECFRELQFFISWS